MSNVQRFLSHVQLAGFALLGAMLDPVTSDPTGLGSGDAGRVWYRTDVPTFKIWNGSAAIDMLARSNQTGTQLAATISNFTAAVQAIQWASMAVPTGPVPMGSQQFSGLAAAASSGQAVEYAQFQTALAAVQSGLDWKENCEVVCTTNVSTAAPGATINGHTMVAGDRVLLTGQTTTNQNGIYTWVSSSSLVRATDANSSGSLASGTMVVVGSADGTNPDSVWMQTATGTGANGSIIPGTDNQSWIKPFTATTYTAGNGITISAGVISAKQGTGTPNSAGAANNTLNGVIVDGNGIYIDPATGVKKFYGLIPSATSAPFTVSSGAVTIAHGLNSQFPQVTVRAGASPVAVNGYTPAAGDKVYVPEQMVDANNVLITLPATPTTGAYTVSIEA